MHAKGLEDPLAKVILEPAPSLELNEVAKYVVAVPVAVVGARVTLQRQLGDLSNPLGEGSDPPAVDPLHERSVRCTPGKLPPAPALGAVYASGEAARYARCVRQQVPDCDWSLGRNGAARKAIVALEHHLHLAEGGNVVTQQVIKPKRSFICHLQNCSSHDAFGHGVHPHQRLGVHRRTCLNVGIPCLLEQPKLAVHEDRTRNARPPAAFDGSLQEWPQRLENALVSYLFKATNATPSCSGSCSKHRYVLPQAQQPELPHCGPLRLHGAVHLWQGLAHPCQLAPRPPNPT
mmetsp:Transcript_44949/g.101104  ORF Transcript_44949/g.101104 Transcript_44949/m.101104 type:complete len:290 (+) Transcript_44949:752-1621(+)